MPWPTERKTETRERIVQAAADAFRQQGIEGAGVADIMKRAGLTHGGFYAHFKSKDDLVKAAFEQMSREIAETVGADAYLSDLHMLHPERGCPLPTVGADLVRSGPKMRRSVAGEIRARVARIAERLGQRRDSETDATGALACMVGCMVLARSLPEIEGKAFLERCRAFLSAALGEEIL